LGRPLEHLPPVGETTVFVSGPKDHGRMGNSRHEYEKGSFPRALATAFASGHDIFFVFWRLNFPDRVPSAYMGQ